MAKKTLLAALILFGPLFFEAKVCFADAAALLEQAKNYLHTGWRQQAEQVYKTIVTDYPGSDYALKAQSELIVLDIPKKENSQIQAAIDSLIADYSGHSDLPDVLCNIAASFGWSDKHEQAKTLYQQVIQQWPASSAVAKAQLGISRTNIVLLIQAGDYSGARAGDYSAAEAQTGQMLEDFSDQEYLPAALYQIAKTYQWWRQFERAESINQEIIRRFPASHEAELARREAATTKALSLIKSDDYAAAEAEIDKLMQDFSGHLGLPVVVQSLAMEYEAQAKYEKAAVLHQQIIQRWPDHSYSSQSQFDFPRTKILALIESGNYADGKAEFDKFTEQFSGDSKLPKAVYDIARQYEWLREYEQARRLYKEVTERYSGSSAAGQAELGLSRVNVLLDVESGNYETASEEVEKLSEGFVEDPDLPEALYRIAKGYQESGEYEQARSILDRVIQQWPESSYAAKARIDARVVNVLLLNNTGDYTATDAAVDSLIADFNDQSALTSAIYQIEEGYYNKIFYADQPVKEDYEQAVKTWKKLMEKLPGFFYDNVDINYFIACCYYQLHKYDNAISYYKRVAGNWRSDRESYARGNLALIEKCYEALTGSGAISQSQAEAEIEQVFDAIIENSPNSISAKYACLKLGRKNFDSGQWADAARYFELFWRNFGDEQGVADIVYDLGRSYAQMGQVNLAVAVYEQFLSTQPSAKIQKELEKLQGKL